MKSKTSKPKKATPKVQVKDLKPKKNPKGGIGLLLPAVQKIRG